MSNEGTGKSSSQSVRFRWNDNIAISASSTWTEKFLTALIGNHCLRDTVPYSVSRNGPEHHMVATLPDKHIAKKAYSDVAKLRDCKDHVDNVFNDLTILRSPVDHDIDICAVHGLEGNAADTFMGKSKLWLRDLLPLTPPFEKARIMTFGYNSQLLEKRTTAGMTDWADLLLSSVGGARQQDGAGNKPIIFVCHSMGGLVTRRAIERLHQFSTIPNHYPGITLDRCGIIFLSTPHLGTVQADYRDLFCQLMSSLTGLRKDAIVRELQSFNASAGEALDVWRIMESSGVMPPFECFSESRKTRVTRFMDREIVTPVAASFMNHRATQLPNADHLQVCKFDEPYSQGYKNVVEGLKFIRIKLLDSTTSRLSEQSSFEPRLPGEPFPTALQYPLVKDRKSYVGGSLKDNKGYFGGRHSLLSELQKSSELETSKDGKDIIALTGVGGIGKSEILLEYALAARQHSHIFHCQALSGQSFRSCIYKLAVDIGSEVLNPDVVLADRELVWTSYTQEQKVRAFIRWLQCSALGPCIILFDDADAFKDSADMEEITEALRNWPHKVLLTTRDPGLGDAIAKKTYRKRKLYVIDGIPEDELLDIMSNFMDEDVRIPSSALRSIARLMLGHAMASCRAVQFICTEMTYGIEEDAIGRFVKSFGDKSDDFEYRKRFLEYKPQLERSLDECFRTSIERLGEDNHAALRILNFAAYLSGPEMDFRLFFKHPRSWLSAIDDQYLPNKEIFQLPSDRYVQVLQKLIATSSVVKTTPTQFSVHPLMIEYLLQKQRLPGRVRILKQIMLLAEMSVQLDENPPLFERYMMNCKSIADRFDIPHHQFTPPPSLVHNIVTVVTIAPGRNPQTLSSRYRLFRPRLQKHTRARQLDSNILVDDLKRLKYVGETRQLVSEFEDLQRAFEAKNVTPPLHALWLDVWNDMLGLVDGINPIYYHKIHLMKWRAEKGKGIPMSADAAGEIDSTA